MLNLLLQQKTSFGIIVELIFTNNFMKEIGWIKVNPI